MDHEAVRKKLHTLRKTETAGSRSVPVVFIASEIHGFEPLCYIGGDEYKEGRTAAGLLQFAAPNVFSTEHQRLNVLILKVSDYVLGHQLRIDGFINELENAATPYAVREIVNITSDADYAYAKTIELLSMYPDIGAIITVSGNAVSVSKAIASLGLKNNLIHICFDQGLLHQLEHIDNSRTAVISQDAYRQGYLSLQILFDYVACEIEPENRRILTHNEIFIKQNQAGDTGF
jgi:LacI family transcriptional regulator